MSHQADFIKCICAAIDNSPQQMRQYLLILMEKANSPFANAFDINILLGILEELARIDGETTKLIDDISHTKKKIYEDVTKADLKNFYFEGLIRN